MDEVAKMSFLEYSIDLAERKLLPATSVLPINEPFLLEITGAFVRRSIPFSMKSCLKDH